MKGERNLCKLNIQVVSLKCPNQTYILSVNDFIKLDFSLFPNILSYIKLPSVSCIEKEYFESDGQFSYYINSRFLIKSNETTDNFTLGYIARSGNESIVLSCSFNVSIFPCNSKCLNCHSNSTNSDPQCKFCNSGYLYETDNNCYADCLERFMKVEQSKRCINCKDYNKYIELRTLHV